MSQPYLVAAYYCDPCDIKMPLIADHAVNDAANFVRAEMVRHEQTDSHRRNVATWTPPRDLDEIK